MKSVKIETEYIKLDQFLKWINVASSGSHAKVLIAEGLAAVNGQIETRRGRKLKKGDTVEIFDQKYKIE